MTKVRTMAFITGLLILGAVPVIKAQDPATQLTPTGAQTDEQQQKEKETAERKATALLEQIVGEVQLLKLPENRIRVQIAAADMLWKRNEARVTRSSSRKAVSFSSACTTNRLRRRGARRQSRLFACWNQSLRHSPNSTRLR